MKSKLLSLVVLMAASVGLTVSAVAAPIDTPAINDQGKAEAHYRIAVMYDNGDGFGRDYQKAAMWYAKAAEQGHTKAQFNLGTLYERGEGVAEDYNKAMSLWKIAADNGATKAQFNIALNHKENKDYAKAVEWYTKAAEQGHADSQNNLGVMYAKGEGVRMNPTKARQLFKQAAAQNQEYAEHNIKQIDQLKQLRTVGTR
ncbi:tetratricopeptide repeat protein [Psychrobacter sp. AOP31-A1-22]|uniref:tetratricopeptide repeat protein n=1 Tax=Psychrobacter sp. AOP31-A1-22 TaxID=3457696 RepID=UPI004036FDB9